MIIEFLIVIFIAIFVELVKFFEIYIRSMETINVLSARIPMLFLGAIIYEIFVIKKMYIINKKIYYLICLLFYI